MRAAPIAILGATSQIALDFLSHAADGIDVCLYARRPTAAIEALRQRGLPAHEVKPLEGFGDRAYCGIVNFIGIGDPAKSVAMGAEILDATIRWDECVLLHLDRQPEIPYVFLSSGAVYGDAFAAPVTATSCAHVPINALGPRNWYALAKLMAEARHRARPDRTIIDIRLFNYISRTLDKSARFLVTDMIRAIETDTVLDTSDAPIVRDYLHPHDMAALITAALAAPCGTNLPIDTYTLAPIGKADLLDLMVWHFGLRYEVVPNPDIVNATGVKPNYYSLNRAAEGLGYHPTRTSAEAIVEELAPIIVRPSARLRA